MLGGRQGVITVLMKGSAVHRFDLYVKAARRIERTRLTTVPGAGWSQVEAAVRRPVLG